MPGEDSYGCRWPTLNLEIGLVTSGAAQRAAGRPTAACACRRAGELATRDFLRGLLDGVRAQLSQELQNLEARQQGSLIKLYAEDPAIHFELWLHRSRGRAAALQPELG
jgi:hypothetical protein